MAEQHHSPPVRCYVRKLAAIARAYVEEGIVHDTIVEARLYAVLGTAVNKHTSDISLTAHPWRGLDGVVVNESEFGEGGVGGKGVETAAVRYNEHSTSCPKCSETGNPPGIPMTFGAFFFVLNEKKKKQRLEFVNCRNQTGRCPHQWGQM